MFQEHWEKPRVCTLRDLPKQRTLGKDTLTWFSRLRMVNDCLSISCWCFPSALLGFSTQSPRVVSPVTKLATPLGITILLFLVWVVYSQSGINFLIACFCVLLGPLMSWASNLIFLIQPWFLFFLINLCICFLLCLQKRIHAGFRKLDSRICEFPVLEKRLHAFVFLHNCICNFLDDFFKSFYPVRFVAWWFLLLYGHLMSAESIFPTRFIFQNILLTENIYPRFSS